MAKRKKRKKKGSRIIFSGPAALRGFLIFFLLASFIIFILHQVPTLNEDLGRRLTTGQIIWESKSIPRANLFSFAEGDVLAPKTHWLSELIFFGVYKLAGFGGLEIAAAILLVLSFGLFLALAWKKRFFIFSTFAFILGGALVLARSEVRPELFGLFCFALFSFILARSKGKINWSFWLLPLVQLFWVNLDVSFWLGWVLVVVFFFDRAWSRRKQIYLAARERRWDRFVLKTGLMCLLLPLVSLINPAGWRGLLSVFLSGAAGQQTFSFLGAQTLLAAVLAVLALFFILNFKRLGFFEVTGLIILSLAAWSRAKYVPFLGLAALPVLTGSFAVLRQKYAKLFLKWELSRFRPVLRLLTVLLLFVILMGSIYVAFSPRLSAKIGKEKFGFGQTRAGAEAAVDFLKESGITGRLFNCISLGDYLIWRLYPEQKVFIDTREQAYSPQLLDDYQQIENSPVAWKDLGQKYAFDLVVWDNANRKSSFPRFVLDTPEWKLVHLDQNVSVWLKESESSREWLEKYSFDDEKLQQRAEQLMQSSDFAGLENLGYFFQTIGKNELAINSFERALEINPAREMAFELGKSYVQNGQNDKAAQAFKRAVGLDDEFVSAYISLGEAYYQDADFSGARQAWEKALQIDSKNREAKFYLENMGLIPFKK